MTEILFRDEHVLVCVKPAGAVSEDAPGGLPELLRKETCVPAVFPVHRLDKGVGGVMVYALTKEAAADLTRQMTDPAAGRTFTKEYYAVAEGIPEPASGRMEDLLFHDSRKNRTYVVKRLRKGVREAVLEYETLQSVSDDPAAFGFSLVHIRLLTGRTHQIRAQFSSRKLPLCGDRRYGAKTTGDIALWSGRLSFRHPETGKELTFTATFPEKGPWNRFYRKCVKQNRPPDTYDMLYYIRK